ncbi:MAG: nitroreductase family protein [Synergistaceae bacterium]|nr:nitroreductase family protein [Synergistaceae bacterium]
MEFFDLIKARYSCRKFANKPVEDDKLTKILEAANLAPTAKNVQPVKIWVFKSNDSIGKVKTVTPCHFNAPVILAVGGTKDGAFVRSDGRNYEDVDACIVATHLMLAVHDLGLGSTWVGFFDAEKLKELFPEMKDFDLVALFPIGYPAEDAQPAERHFIRKNLDELVKYL